jgi:hypothetical protein
MAYEMSITLTDEEYKALAIEAAKNGKPIEALLHEVLSQHIKPSASGEQTLTSRRIQEYLYREGIIESLPTNEKTTPEENARREYLARLFGQGKLASDMVIEDRGPR